MKKRFLTLLLAFSLLAVPARAAENSTDNFVRDTGTRAYTGQFPDVPQDHAFYHNIAALYEFGLTRGKADGTFGPADSVTVSQTVIFAGRIRSLYRTGDPDAGPAAHRTGENRTACLPYLAYLKAEGVLGSELDETLFAPATRAQVAHVLANVLPEAVLPPINQEIFAEVYAQRKFATDVDEYTPYQQDILRLYRCGISRGNDAMGTFLPNHPITRGALSAMLTRLVDEDLRVRLVWTSREVPDVSRLTLADLVEPGEYVAAPETDEELDEALRYMLSRGERQLDLVYPDGISLVQARSRMQRAVGIIKTYCEQGYNTASCVPSAGGKLRLTFSAVGAENSVEEYRQYTLDAAREVHDTLWGQGVITPDMTQLEKARMYYIWICMNTEYDENADERSLAHMPYSVFKTGRAVCDGYTGAYNLLLKLEGIDCIVCMTETHIWTVAVLDGVEYHIDTTWGDVGDGADSVYFATPPELSMALHADVF